MKDEKFIDVDSEQRYFKVYINMFMSVHTFIGQWPLWFFGDPSAQCVKTLCWVCLKCGFMVLS